MTNVSGVHSRLCDPDMTPSPVQLETQWHEAISVHFWRRPLSQQEGSLRQKKTVSSLKNASCVHLGVGEGGLPSLMAPHARFCQLTRKALWGVHADGASPGEHHVRVHWFIAPRVCWLEEAESSAAPGHSQSSVQHKGHK